MKNKRLLNIIREIDDRHIAEAAPALIVNPYGLNGGQWLLVWFC